MKFEDIATISVGQILTRVESENSEIHYTVLHPRAIVNGFINDSQLDEINVSKAIDDDKITREGDVVIKLSTPYEAVVIDKEHENLLIPSFCAVFRCKTDIDPYFICALINSSYIREKIKSKIAGTVRPMVRISDLRLIDFPEINKHKMKKYGAEYKLSLKKRELLSKMTLNEIEIMNNKLAKLILEEAEYDK